MKKIAALAACSALLACSAHTPLPEPAPGPTVAAADLAKLERACLQDPLNARAWRRLGAELGRLGQGGRAAQALRQATMIEQNDLRADLAMVERSSATATRLVVRADGMLELRRDEAPPESAVLLEISNGNGVRGMARSFARAVEGGDMRVVRLSNQRGFAVGESRIEYHDDYAAAAHRLADRIGTGKLMRTEGSLGAVNVRVVLGHDQARKKPPRRAAMEERSLLKKIS
jgi:hypothetical protein